jgi:hypothetical protein
MKKKKIFYSIWKAWTLRSFVTFRTMYQMTWRHIPEGLSVLRHCCENEKLLITKKNVIVSRDVLDSTNRDKEINTQKTGLSTETNFKMLASKNMQILTHQKQLATCWKVRGSNPSGSKKFSVFHTLPDRTWGPINFLYNSTVDLPLD